MRMVIILRFQEDLKLSEISTTMDMPVNTVKTTLRRALARLREKAHNLELEVCYAAARTLTFGKSTLARSPRPISRRG